MFHHWALNDEVIVVKNKDHGPHAGSGMQQQIVASLLHLKREFYKVLRVLVLYMGVGGWFQGSAHGVALNGAWSRII